MLKKNVKVVMFQSNVQRENGGTFSPFELFRLEKGLAEFEVTSAALRGGVCSRVPPGKKLFK